MSTIMAVVVYYKAFTSRRDTYLGLRDLSCKSYCRRTITQTDPLDTDPLISDHFRFFQFLVKVSV